MVQRRRAVGVRRADRAGVRAREQTQRRRRAGAGGVVRGGGFGVFVAHSGGGARAEKRSSRGRGVRDPRLGLIRRAAREETRADAAGADAVPEEGAVVDEHRRRAQERRHARLPPLAPPRRAHQRRRAGLVPDARGGAVAQGHVPRRVESRGRRPGPREKGTRGVARKEGVRPDGPERGFPRVKAFARLARRARRRGGLGGVLEPPGRALALRLERQPHAPRVPRVVLRGGVQQRPAVAERRQRPTPRRAERRRVRERVAQNRADRRRRLGVAPRQGNVQRVPDILRGGARKARRFRLRRGVRVVARAARPRSAEERAQALPRARRARPVQERAPRRDRTTGSDFRRSPAQVRSRVRHRVPQRLLVVRQERGSETRVGGCLVLEGLVEGASSTPGLDARLLRRRGRALPPRGRAATAKEGAGSSARVAVDARHVLPRAASRVVALDHGRTVVLARAALAVHPARGLGLGPRSGSRTTCARRRRFLRVGFQHRARPPPARRRLPRLRLRHHEALEVVVVPPELIEPHLRVQLFPLHVLDVAIRQLSLFPAHALRQPLAIQAPLGRRAAPPRAQPRAPLGGGLAGRGGGGGGRGGGVLIIFEDDDFVSRPIRAASARRDVGFARRRRRRRLDAGNFSPHWLFPTRDADRRRPASPRRPPRFVGGRRRRPRRRLRASLPLPLR